MNQGGESSEAPIEIIISKGKDPEGQEAKSFDMGTVKTGGHKFEVAKYDGRSDYLLWERQVKVVLKATGLGRLLKPKPSTVTEEDWKDMQEMAVNTVMLYLQPHVIKQVEEHVCLLYTSEAAEE